MMIKNSFIRDKEDTKKLLDLLKIKYGFSGFYHYTDYSNLQRIFEAGALIGRNRIETGFHDSANQAVLTQAPTWIHDQVRLFYFPKTPFLYGIEGIKTKSIFGEGPHMPRPVALLFSEDVAYINGIKYCDGSASYLLAPNEDHVTAIEKEAKKAMGFNWCLISSRGPIPSRYGSVAEVCGEKHGPTITNRRNAEILIPDKLSLSYLKGIAFRSEADRKQAIQEFGDNTLFSVDFGLFNNNNAYLYDYSVAWTKRSKDIHIDLEIFPGLGSASSVSRYKHSMRLYSYDNMRIEEAFDFQHRCESVDLNDCEDITKVEYYMDNTLCAAWEINK